MHGASYATLQNVKSKTNSFIPNYQLPSLKYQVNIQLKELITLRLRLIRLIDSKKKITRILEYIFEFFFKKKKKHSMGNGILKKFIVIKTCRF